MLSETETPRAGRAPVNKSPTAAAAEKSGPAKNLHNKSRSLSCSVTWASSERVHLYKRQTMTLPRETYATQSRPRPRRHVLDPVICINFSPPLLVGTGQRGDNADSTKQMTCLTLQPFYPWGSSPSNHSLDYRCEWTIGTLVPTKVSQSVRLQTVHPVPLEVFPPARSTMNS